MPEILAGSFVLLAIVIGLKVRSHLKKTRPKKDIVLYNDISDERNLSYGMGTGMLIIGWKPKKSKADESNKQGRIG